MSSQIEDAFNEALERRASGYEQRIAALDDLVQRAWSLIAGAMSGNPHKPTANSEWMDAAHAWEIDYCMGQGSAGGEGFAAGRAAASPDPPDPRLDAVYAERNAVVLGLAKAGLMLGWRVGKASDPNEPDWPVVYIDTPAGQVSWHFRAADVPDWVEPYPGEWDRHSDREKYERLSRLPVSPAASPDERLREALRTILCTNSTPDRRFAEPRYFPWENAGQVTLWFTREQWDEFRAALAAADREAPDEPDDREETNDA